MTQPAGNTIEARAAPFIERVENLKEALASEQGAYMARCKAIRDDIKEVYTEAKDADLPIKALKQIVKYRDLERKQEALAEEMEGDEGAYDYEMLVAALGTLSDTPLGQAALDLNSGGEDGEDVRPRFRQTEDDAPTPKRGRKAKAAEPSAASPEEAAALAEIEAGGIAGATEAVIGSTH